MREPVHAGVGEKLALPALPRLPVLLHSRVKDDRSRAALHVLSMGMSDDFEAAIAEGATLIRIGRAVFGERRKAAKGA